MNLPYLLALSGLLLVVAYAAAGLSAYLGASIRRGVPWVLATVCLLLAPWLFGDRLVSPTNLLLGGMLPGIEVQAEPTHQLLNDTFLQFLPWEAEIREQWSRGEPAFWAPSLEGGSSPWQNPQAGVLSPIAVVARVFPLRFHLLVALALKLTLGGLGVAALARATGCRLEPSLLAAVAFCLSGPSITWGLFPHTSALAFVPWLMLGCLSLARRPNRRRLALTAGLLMMVALSGHPEVGFFGGLAAAVVALAFRRRSLGLWPVLGWNASAALLGLCLSGPTLLPFLHQLPQTQRFHEMTQREAATSSVLGFESSRADLLQSLATPYAYGRPYRDSFEGSSNWAEALSGAPGAPVLMGSLLLLIAHRRLRGGFPLAFLALSVFAALCWLSAAGWAPLAGLLERLPLFGVLEFRRSLLVAGILLAVLAAHGLGKLVRRPSPWLLLAAVVPAGLALILGARDGEPLAWLLLIAAVAPTAMSKRHRQVLLVAAVLLAQLPWSWRMLPRSAPESFFPTSPLVERLAASDALATGPYRVVGSNYELYPSLLPIWGLDELRPHNPMASHAYTDLLARVFDFRSQTSSGSYFSAFANLEDPLLSFLNVAAAIQPAHETAPEGWSVLAEAAGRRVVSNPEVLPRWFSPLSWTEAAVRPDRGPPREVSVRDCDGLEDANFASVPDPIVLSLDADDVRLRLPSPFPPLLATSVPWSSGWQAGSSGQTFELCRVNEAFVGVVVPPGTETLRLSFVPPGLHAGLLLFALATLVSGWLGVSGWLVAGPQRRRRIS